METAPSASLAMPVPAATKAPPPASLVSCTPSLRLAATIPPLRPRMMERRRWVPSGRCRFRSGSCRREDSPGDDMPRGGHESVPEEAGGRGLRGGGGVRLAEVKLRGFCLPARGDGAAEGCGVQCRDLQGELGNLRWSHRRELRVHRRGGDGGGRGWRRAGEKVHRGLGVRGGVRGGEGDGGVQGGGSGVAEGGSGGGGGGEGGCAGSGGCGAEVAAGNGPARAAMAEEPLHARQVGWALPADCQPSPDLAPHRAAWRRREVPRGGVSRGGRAGGGSHRPDPVEQPATAAASSDRVLFSLSIGGDLPSV
ncbi:unnamed protein product [Musa textilis]